ncbi:uncharacterized protein BDZ83DRAFT_342224 [Colletotrichum acutatum]|uniref:Uncharacterized protein n=1 Tax=Glomerella acutata TaxID=27357 RepID=A0AAD8XNQ0_GLOAC|nr:uncharacterized protein BDZ83DRAFT_342224 [Colletotrichum acutatum]KAK1730835.1 hypothetical protein BDZ83DRAFT_342224 [Colletotrichum acutatum]
MEIEAASAKQSNWRNWRGSLRPASVWLGPTSSAHHWKRIVICRVYRARPAIRCPGIGNARRMRIGRCLFPIQCLIIIAIVLVVGSGGGKAASFTAFSPTEGGVPSARSWMNSDNATSQYLSALQALPGFGRSRSFAGTAREHGGLFYAEETEFPPMQSGARDSCCTCRAALNSKSRDVWGMAIGKTTMDQTNQIPCGPSSPTTQDGPGAYEANERASTGAPLGGQ